MSDHREQNGTETHKEPLDEHHTPKQLMYFSGSQARIVSASQLASEVEEDWATVNQSASFDARRAQDSRVLVIYTGGTIGMKSIDGVYCPVPFYLPQAIRELPPLNDNEYIEKFYSDALVKPFCLPPLRNMKKRVLYWIVEYEPLLDSSDMTFDDWIRIGMDIQKAYRRYDGFVILHGTDTLSYTACALSFMLENLGKPVIITGAQIPVCEVRSDGRENLIGALIVAGNLDIPEVTVYFNNKLYRGNRTKKIDNRALEAFDSPNMPPIARTDITINVNYEAIHRPTKILPFVVHDNLCRNVGLLRIFPSISIESVRASLQCPVQGVVLQTFGAGNMPSKRTDIVAEIKKAIDRGCIIINCSQCIKGQVDVHYFTGKILYDVGVITGSDMTAEAALTKLSYVLGKDNWDHETKLKMLKRNLRGELTVVRSENLQDLEIVPHLARFLHLSSSQEMQILRDTIFPPLLCHAANSGDVVLLENLRDSGANLSAVDYNGRSALHVAASAGHMNVVLFLLKNGVSVHLRDCWDENAIVNAVRSKEKSCIKCLKDAGSSLSCNPLRIGTEMCFCAYGGDKDALSAWIFAGASVNQADYDGRTPLHMAVVKNNDELVEYLLDEGADPMRTDHFGITPIAHAKKMGFSKIIDKLEEFRIKSKAKFAFG